MPRPSHSSRLRILALLAALASLAPVGLARNQQATESVHLQTFDRVWETVRDAHYDPDLGGVDWQRARDELRPDAEKATSGVELRGTLHRLLARLGQSHLKILPGESMPPRPDPEGETRVGNVPWDTGHGFAVGLVEGQVRVTSVEPGSSVADDGVESGWQILRVGDSIVPTPARSTGSVTFPLLESEGTSARIQFEDPEGGEHWVEVPIGSRRGRTYQFEGLPPIPVWIESRRLEGDLGYIAFNWFFDPVQVMGEFHRAMASFSDTRGLVIDLRGNNGGLSPMVNGMIAWFVDREVSLGTVSSRGVDVRSIVTPRGTPYQRPVAVLIDGRVGSAAEIFAAGIRDVAGARLFGQTTRGAVLPSAFDRLPNGDYLQYVVANYVTDGGVQLEGVGVVPDEQTAVVGDAALDAAIDWILTHEQD